MAKKRVLVVGSGGREHALSWKLSQSPEIGDLFVAPGNGGTLQVADNVNIQATDIQGLLRFAKDQRVDLTVIGPEDPLVAGIADVFRQQGLRVFGPSAQAAELESSKAFAKRLMANHLIQTAPFEIFDDYQTAVNYLNECCFAPVVVKASGLALGKGAYPCHTLDQAQTVLEDIMVNGIHQEAGKVVIIEKFLHGQEASIHALSNGIDALMLPASQDHKAAFDNDTGPNTGGMGCFAPIPWYNAEYLAHAKSAIVFPVLRAMGQKATPWSTAFIGCLYPGLMVQGETDQSVLEFNVRFGDPETQALMRLLKGDLFRISWPIRQRHQNRRYRRRAKHRRY
ncbi:MAG: purD [Candidatus Berkelbacteria bacterium]|nr:purD [Candidatus Berkelbacteria bacterium]